MDERSAEQIKHLEFVQANIARMHSASTSMKRFALAAFALGGTLARFLNDSTIVGLTLVVVLSFFVLDAKYLQAERAFRVLFDCVRKEQPGTATSFELTPTIKNLIPLRELTSWSTSLLYIPMLILLALLFLGTDWQTPSIVENTNG